MNNKGFMMAEVVVVAAVILGAFAFFYVNYNSLISLNNERVAYYDVGTLYKLADFVIDNRIDIRKNRIPKLSSSNYYINLKNASGESIYLFNQNFFMSNFHLTFIDKVSINKTFQKYLRYLSQSKDIDANNYLLVMEKCQRDDKNKYTKNCKYAYLETAV